MKNIGKFLKKVRKERKLTQAKLARFGGISQSAFSKIEKGQLMPNIDVIEKVLKGLGMELGIVVKVK